MKIGKKWKIGEKWKKLKMVKERKNKSVEARCDAPT